MKNENDKIVIVGAGMAGLTAAAYLARNNHNVLLLEKNEKTGGLLGTYEKNGFFFDSGPRALVNSGIIKPILSDLGISWEYLDNKISIGIEDQLVRVNSIEDLQEYQKVLDFLYPENKADIEKIIGHIYRLSEYTKVLYEFDNPNFSGRMKDKNYIFKQLLPWMFKFLQALRKLNKFNMPMENFLQKITQNHSLIDIVTQHFFRNTPTYFALGYFYVYLDYFYPKGGTGSLNTLLREKVLSSGCEIKLNKQITEIIPSESKVIDAEGVSYHYDYLVWAADLKTFYRNLNPIGLDSEIAQKVEMEKQLILSSKGAESIFMINLGINRPPFFFREICSEHIFFTPSRHGLSETNRGERENLIEDFDHKSKKEILDWLDEYINLNTYEISIPVLRDRTLAPEGQTGLMISCLFDYQVFKKVEEAGWYGEFKNIVEDRICNLITSTVFRDIKDDILFRFSSSPLTINKLCGSSEGAITGWSFEKEPPVINKLQDVPKSVLTPVSNILQAGQWAYAPAGVPIAMLTGWYASQRVNQLSSK